MDQLVLDACTILVDNQPGYLVPLQLTSNIPWRDSSGRVVEIKPGPNELRVLKAGDYWFYREDAAVYELEFNRKFADWKPPFHLPPHWAALQTKPLTAKDMEAEELGVSPTLAVQMGDRKCIITGCPARLEIAYVVPVSEGVWFVQNDLVGKAHDSVNMNTGIYGAANMLAMRQDVFLHSFDTAKWAFYPYDGDSLCIFLTNGNLDLAWGAHCAIIALPARIRAHYLYSRFAWAIFALRGEYERSLGLPDTVKRAKRPTSQSVSSQHDSQGSSQPRKRQKLSRFGGNSSDASGATSTSSSKPIGYLDPEEQDARLKVTDWLGEVGKAAVRPTQ
ncbi:hypothetical protein C8R46DRAFT_1124376 [Mycena filopes]|nr:hypothetical protein C8R46DRAFT_1124376 [Mycena filopes]